MSFTCPDPNGHTNCELKIQDTRAVYEHAKYCKVCEIFVEYKNNRCPCCNSPLRTKSKKYKIYSVKYLVVKPEMN